MENIRGQDPLRRPVKCKRSPKPLCHGASKELRKRLRLAYRGFVAMFQEASLKVKFRRVSEAIFPKGSFPRSITSLGDLSRYLPILVVTDKLLLLHKSASLNTEIETAVSCLQAAVSFIFICFCPLLVCRT